MANTNSSNRLDQLLAEHQQNPPEYAMPEDRWAAVKQQIQPAAATNRLWSWALSSAAALVLAVTVVTANYQQPVQQPLLELLSTLETHQQLQRETLQSSFQQVGFKPTEVVVDTEVAQLQQASALVIAQLRDDPTNKALWDMLQWLHQQELELLRNNYQRGVTWYDV